MGVGMTGIARRVRREADKFSLDCVCADEKWKMLTKLDTRGKRLWIGFLSWWLVLAGLEPKMQEVDRVAQASPRSWRAEIRCEGQR
jgi:hypothetical protein